MTEPLVYRFELETRADPQATFRVLSDTDAFNRAAHAGFEYDDAAARGGERRGLVRRLGMTLRFREPPFSFRSPSRLETVRLFDEGLARELRTAIEIAPSAAGGTRIAYELTVVPSGLVAKGLLAMDLPRSTLRHVRAALDAAVKLLDARGGANAEHTLAGPPPPLTQQERARVTERVERLPVSEIRDKLARFVEEAPEREQLLISPFTLAEAWSSPLHFVGVLLVDAARVGVLGVRVDLLCPACLIPRARLDATGAATATHCESCAIPLDPAFPESLAVHFFTSPTIRPLRDRLECLGSPARTPHVVAQEALAAGASADLATPLEPGMYQLRTLPAAGPAAMIEVVSPTASATPPASARFAIGPTIQPQLARVAPNPTSIAVTNTTGAPLVALLETVARPRRYVTLARLLVELPEIREVLPESSFYGQLSAYLGAAIAVRAPDPERASGLTDELARRGARAVYASGLHVLAHVADLDVALDLALSLDRREFLVGVATGSCAEHASGGRVVPVGAAVDAAFDAANGAVFGAIAVSAQTSEDPALLSFAAARSLAFDGVRLGSLGVGLLWPL
jgi:hypothetical protein